MSVKAETFRGGFLASRPLLFLPFDFIFCSAFSISNARLNALNFMIHAVDEKTFLLLNGRLGSEWDRRCVPASFTPLQSALSSVFVAFGSVESSRCFTPPPGHLTLPAVGVSMCVRMCCQQIFPWNFSGTHGPGSPFKTGFLSIH